MKSREPPAPSLQPARDDTRLAYLDQALWKRLGVDKSADPDPDAWLTLQCGMVSSAVSGVLVLGPPDVGPFKPACQWPADRPVSQLVTAAAEMAVTRRRGVVKGEEAKRPSGDLPGGTFGVAYPIMADEALHGVVAVEIAGAAEGDLRAAMRQLQWGAAWIEVMLRRRELREDAGRQERVATALDLIADALEESRFDSAAMAVVTTLAGRMGCERVSIGFLRDGRAEVAAISHTARFSRQMNVVRQIAAAMDEALDQRATLHYPPCEDDALVTREHAELARDQDAGELLTVPLFVRNAFFGALTLEMPEGKEFHGEQVELCETVAAVVGPILYEKRLNDRPLVRKIGDATAEQWRRLVGARYPGRKLAATIILALVLFFTFAKDQYRVAADAVLEGEIQRVVASPLDGYIRSAEVRAGDTVREGQAMASLDDRDLLLERQRWLAEQRQKLLEYDQAQARGERANARIIQAQIAQAEAQIALLDEQLSRVRMIAPFDGVVISGDLTQSIGKAVRRGETLFEIAPLESYRVVLKVDEADIDEIAEEQAGKLVIASMPGDSFPLVVDQVTPVSTAEEGQNYFRVEARLPERTTRLRPGMTGVGKVEVGERRLVWIWTHRLFDWLRLKTWAWLP